MVTALPVLSVLTLCQVGVQCLSSSGLVLPAIPGQPDMLPASLPEHGAACRPSFPQRCEPSPVFLPKDLHYFPSSEF